MFTMILTKLELLNLDLPIWSYKIYKIALKTRIFELSSTQRSLTSGALGSDDPTGQREENRGDSDDGAAHGEAHRQQLLRRN